MAKRRPRDVTPRSWAWIRDAACGGLARAMEALDEGEAKAICRGCPVITDCYTWVIRDLRQADDPAGVVAGLNPRQRRKLRRRHHRRRQRAS